jgi:hypothetical protein
LLDLQIFENEVARFFLPKAARKPCCIEIFINMKEKTGKGALYTQAKKGSRKEKKTSCTIAQGPERPASFFHASNEAQFPTLEGGYDFAEDPIISLLSNQQRCNDEDILEEFIIELSISLLDHRVKVNIKPLT